MALNKIFGALAISLLASVASAQTVINIPAFGTDPGTAGDDLFFVGESADATAYLEGGADAIVLVGGNGWGAFCDTADCCDDDFVFAINGAWDLIEADWGDLLWVEDGDAVHLRDCTGTVTAMTGKEYNELFEAYNGFPPGDVDPFEFLGWNMEPEPN